MKRLVLFNGGLKDTFLAVLAKKEGTAALCYVKLGHDELRLPKVARLAATLDLPLFIVDLTESPPLEEVLLRMLYLTLQALPVAKEQQCKCIYHGLSREDDLRIVPVIDAFTKQLNDLVQLGQPLYDGHGFWLGNVEIEVPLRCLDRPRILRLGNEWNLPWELTHSCTRSARVHCGQCAGCRRRRSAFRREGCEDKTGYIER